MAPPNPQAALGSGGGPAPEPDAIQAVVARGIADYLAARRAAIPEFVRRTYGPRGAIGLHRHAIGWDLARAPVNVLLAVPQLSILLAGLVLRRLGARRVGRWLEGRRLFFGSAVARAVF